MKSITVKIVCPDCGNYLVKHYPKTGSPFLICSVCREEFYEDQREPDHIDIIRTPFREGHRCGKCGEIRDDVEDRDSYGIYAGRFCVPCCSSYRDNCGVDRPQGDPADLDETYEAEDYYAKP